MYTNVLISIVLTGHKSCLQSVCFTTSYSIFYFVINSHTLMFLFFKQFLLAAKAIYSQCSSLQIIVHFFLLYTTYTIAQKYIQLKTKHFQFIQNHLLNHVFTFILSPIIANILSIEIFDNLSLEKYKGPEKSFVLQVRLAKKQNIKINLERKDYIISLRRVMDTISSKCTIYGREILYHKWI